MATRYMSGMPRFRLRSVLWFDCAAAGIAGVAMLVASGVLAPLFGVPRGTRSWLGVAYLLAEGAFVGVLAAVERAALRDEAIRLRTA